MILDYTLNFGIYYDSAKNKTKTTELIYDKIRFITSANIKTDNDILDIEVLEHKLNIDYNTKGRQLPLRNSMKMSQNDYREFISTLGFSSKYFKQWINQYIFAGGVKFPYKPTEFKTDLII